MSEIRQPVLALKLQTPAGGQQAEDIEVEMTKDELDRVLDVNGNCHAGALRLYLAAHHQCSHRPTQEIQRLGA